MNKYILLLATLMMGLGINAQVVKVYKNGDLITVYTNTEDASYKVAFAESMPTHTGSALNANSLNVDWVQLWDDGPKWAVYNIGSENLVQTGGYYGWGNETNQDENHAYCKCTADIQGTNYDMAKLWWGSNWMMPTKSDYDNLVAKTDGGKWVDNYNETGKSGLLFTGKGDYAFNSVFFPAEGYYLEKSVIDNEEGSKSQKGYYWTSTPSENNAYILFIPTYSSGSVNSFQRSNGCSVRAIIDENASDMKNWVKAITINAKNVKISDVTTTQTVTINPSDAINTSVTWSSSDPTIATIDANTGVMKGLKVGTVTITAAANDDSGVTATCDITTYDGTGSTAVAESAGITDNIVSWVQMWENGPKWATFNVGATKNSEYGNLYVWGSTSTTWNSYATASNIQGTDADTAYKLWGTNWQMPTQSDYENLLANTDGGKWVENYNETDVNGVLFTGVDAFSDCTLFFPAAGYHQGNADSYKGEKCTYWSATQDNGEHGSELTSFGMSSSGSTPSVESLSVTIGRSVRAIVKE